ncbi:ATP-dependent nuclease [Bremerella sp.]|uniref:ATP-dependent nuclease n=1 Tax=Bremerella sp. TaxID=2795602 RepID=UPI00391B8C29
MYITRIMINGFKKLKSLELALNKNITVVIGDNETGKSSVLEAIHLVLSKQYQGRAIDYTLDPYLFNMESVAEFFHELRNGRNAAPPRILIEAYFGNDPENPSLAKLRGLNNSKNEDCSGIKLLIEVDPDYLELLKDYAKDTDNPTVLPVEFYRCHWRSFAGNGIHSRYLDFKLKNIDTSLPRIVRGPNRYVSQLVDDVLSEDQRRQLSLAYKKLRHGFSQEEGVNAINSHLKERAKSSTDKTLTVQVDMSSRSSWDSAITAHLDDMPFDCAGKGEQCRIQMSLAIADSKHSRMILIEEPENHLSHSNLAKLMNDISRDCSEHQVVVTTHSAFVLNKLGLNNLCLMSRIGEVMKMTSLRENTREYFMKLPGYDTLRLILSRRCILVEGPSDELIVQRAYRNRHGKLPLEDGVDVISVRSLAFKRFLEIAVLLGVEVAVVIDNDGQLSGLEERYKDFLGTDTPRITISYDNDEMCPTLEPQLLKANSLKVLNNIFETKHATDAKLLKYMSDNKTDCALKLFETEHKWKVPEYIVNVT